MLTILELKFKIKEQSEVGGGKSEEVLERLQVEGTTSTKIC